MSQNTEFSDQSAALDYLEELASHPVNVNSAGIDEFLRIPGIIPLQATQIISLRKMKGSFAALDEVRQAGNIPEKWFILIKQFLSLRAPVEVKSLRIRQRNQQALEKAKGFINGSYKGSPLKNYTRLYISPTASIVCGALIEKDAGEKRFNDHQVGFIRYSLPNKQVNVIAGNYSLDFAQGLLFSRNSFFDKGQDPINPISRRSSAAKGFYSSNESEGFFGITGTVSFRNMTLTSFNSRTKRDAVLSSNGDVTSLLLSGLHRTLTESAECNTLNEQVDGFRLSYSQNHALNVGLTGAFMRYRPEFMPRGTNQFANKFSGNYLQLAGIDVSFIRNNFEFVGEAGCSEPGSGGMVTGFIWSEDNTSAGVLYRNYGIQFYSPFGNAFSDRTAENRNERGMYIGITHSISKQVRLALYIDTIEFPQPTPPIIVSKRAQEYFSQIVFFHNKTTQWNIFWKKRTGITGSEYVDSYGIQRTFYEDEITDRIRIQGDFQPFHSVRFISRYEIQSLRRQSEQNPFVKSIFNNPDRLCSGRIIYNRSIRMQNIVELAFFSTHHSRFYQYESDLPGVFTIKQYSGRGMHCAIIVQYKWNGIAFSGKYGIVKYLDRNIIGTGAGAIHKNYMQDIGIQADIIL